MKNGKLIKKKIVLFGTGMEGEKFYWKHRNEFEIEYCVDRKCGRTFHGINVYSFNEVKEDIKEGHFVIITAVGAAYLAIKKILMGIGLQEFNNFLGAALVGRKLAIIYGNCHMETLEEYLTNNYYFKKRYIVRRYHVGNFEYPTELELKHCDLLIGEDIREENSAKVPSINELIRKTGATCQHIIVPNLHGYNLFFPQLENDVIYERKHLNQDAIDINTYSKEDAVEIKYIVKRLGYKDINIERLYIKGYSYEDIISYIADGKVYDDKEVRKNFKEQLERIKEREKLCDIKISDYIEANYKENLLFYDPEHPTELLVCEKGRRVLKLLNIPIDETIPVRHRLDWQEVFIYGCVKKALGMKFEQNCIRRGHTENTLSNRPIDLEEYVLDYIAWVCEEE